jgi:6-phosphogluconate dehydrogenase
MQLGMIGLGRMGANMVRRLMQKGHECVVFDANAEAVAAVTAAGAVGTSSVEEFIGRLKPPRAVWIMLPVPVVEGVVKTVAAHLGKGDILIDGGNSPFENAIRRASDLKPMGIHFIDVGTSGGVWGLERGYCLMIGGPPEAVERLEPVFRDLAPGKGDVEPVAGRDPGAAESRGYLHCGPPGAGHFVKMVHNGIEYGMMAAYAEGFNLLRHAGAGLREGPGAPDTPERYQYDFDLGAIAELWRRGSVVTSWLLDLTAASLAEDPQLKGFHGRVSDSGEGRWTLKAAIDTAVPVPVLSAALYSRFESRGEAEFAGRLLSAMRFQFGGHRETNKP